MTYRVLSPRCCILRVSLQQPDCSPSTGSRSGQAPPPVWPAKTTEVGSGECTAPRTDATESPYSVRPLTVSSLGNTEGAPK